MQIVYIKVFEPEFEAEHEIISNALVAFEIISSGFKFWLKYLNLYLFRNLALWEAICEKSQLRKPLKGLEKPTYILLFWNSESNSYFFHTKEFEIPRTRKKFRNKGFIKEFHCYSRFFKFRGMNFSGICKIISNRVQ